MTHFTRRDLLKAAAAAGATVALPRLAFADPPSRPPARPNVIVMMVDDMGFSDLGCLGSEIQTPNLDNLAKNGVLFPNGHSCARCWPSRACILTGQYPHQMGYENKTPISDEERRLRRSGGLFIPEILSGAGYTTCMAGKWHLDGRPDDRGFHDADFVFRGQGGGSGGAGSFWHKSFGPTEYVTDHIGTTVAGQVEQYARQKKPFFIYWTPTAPHWPLHAFTADMAKYKGVYDAGPKAVAEARLERMRERGIFDRRHPWTAPPYVTKPNKRLADVCTELEKDTPKRQAKGTFKPCHWKSLSYGNRRKAASYEEMMEIYAAQMDRLDQSLGTVIAKLKETGAYDNTLLLFCSDNGASSEQMGNGRAWASVSNTPFKLWKKDSYEGGTATPFILHWPAATPQDRRGTINRTWCHLVDVMPTVLAAAGATHPVTDRHGREVPPEGRGILPALQGETVPLDRPIFIDHKRNRAVITGEWKLVAQEGDPWSLYNMDTDRFESNDLAGREPERVKALERAWNDWARRVGAFIPGESPEPDGKSRPKKSKRTRKDK